MQIIERLEDYTLERLAVVRDETGLHLHGWFGGVECRLEAKPSWLAAGLVACHPLDADLALDWPMACRVVADDSAAQIVNNTTAEPRAAAALRRLEKAMEDGTARPGMDIEKGGE